MSSCLFYRILFLLVVACSLITEGMLWLFLVFVKYIMINKLNMWFYYFYLCSGGNISYSSWEMYNFICKYVDAFKNFYSLHLMKVNGFACVYL